MAGPPRAALSLVLLRWWMLVLVLVLVLWLSDESSVATLRFPILDPLRATHGHGIHPRHWRQQLAEALVHRLLPLLPLVTLSPQPSFPWYSIWDVYLKREAPLARKLPLTLS